MATDRIEMDELVEERPVAGALVRHRGARMERHVVERSATRLEVRHGALWIRATDAGPGVLASHGACTVQVRQGAAVLEVSDVEALLVVVSGRAAVKGTAALPRSVTAGQAITLTFDGTFGSPEPLSSAELAADRFVVENLARDALAAEGAASPPDADAPAPGGVGAAAEAPIAASADPAGPDPMAPPAPATPGGSGPGAGAPDPMAAAVVGGGHDGPVPSDPRPATGADPGPLSGLDAALAGVGMPPGAQGPNLLDPGTGAGPVGSDLPDPGAAGPDPFDLMGPEAGPSAPEPAATSRSFFDPEPLAVPAAEPEPTDLDLPEPGRRGLVAVVVVLVLLAAVVGAIVLTGDEPRSAPDPVDPAPTTEATTGTEADAAPAEATVQACEAGAAGFVARGVASGGGPDTARYDVVVGLQDVAGEVYAEKTATVAAATDPGTPVSWTAELALPAAELRPDSECLVVQVDARP